MYGSDDHVFTLSHICRAPIELVWQIWTGEQYLQNWLQPEEMHMTPMSMELHPEGEFRYRLSTTDDSKMWGKWVFIEIDPLERLVVIIAFTDEDGETAHYPELESAPMEIFYIFEFRTQNGNTLLTLEATPYLGTKDEIATFDMSHIDMTQQWRNCFDRLDRYLKQLQQPQHTTYTNS